MDGIGLEPFARFALVRDAPATACGHVEVGYSTSYNRGVHALLGCQVDLAVLCGIHDTIGLG